MIRRPPRFTRTDTLLPYTTLFRSVGCRCARARRGGGNVHDPVAVPAVYGHVQGRGRHQHVRSASPQEPFRPRPQRSEEHTSELQSLMRISYAVFCLKKKTKQKRNDKENHNTDTH